MYELAKQILEQTDGKICKNCLGRKLSKTIEGKNNIERADKVCEELDINLDDVDCVICDNIFDKLNDDLYKKIDDKINQLGVEFDTFLVGSKIPKDIQERDDKLSAKFNLTVETLKKEISELCDILGIITEKKADTLEAEVEELIAERQAARKAKDFAKADEIRDKLLAMGIQLKDTREGVQWKRI